MAHACDVRLSSVLSISFLPSSGTSWAVVDSPSPDVAATHVAVGMNVVWALTKDNKVRAFCHEHHKRSATFLKIK